MGLALSPDILQFGAVLVKVCVKDFAFALGVFAVLVVGSPKLVAPANEGGPCGQSTNVFAWALSVYRLDLDAVRATGGIDAELYARRVRMRLALFGPAERRAAVQRLAEEEHGHDPRAEEARLRPAVDVVALAALAAAELLDEGPEGREHDGAVHLRHEGDGVEGHEAPEGGHHERRVVLRRRRAQRVLGGFREARGRWRRRLTHGLNAIDDILGRGEVSKELQRCSIKRRLPRYCTRAAPMAAISVTILPDASLETDAKVSSHLKMTVPASWIQK